MWYVPPHITQRTGSKCQFSLCWATIGAWLHRAATGGTASLTPEEFAKAAGGGTGGKNQTTGCDKGLERDLLRGLDNLGVRSKILKVSRARALEILSVERRNIFAVSVDYDAWPKAKDCMNGTAGPDVNHMVGIIGGAKPQIENPLCTDYQEVSLPAVLAAAGKYASNNGRQSIWLVRVARPIPASLPADQKRIAELEGQLANAFDAMAEIASLNSEADDILAQFRRETR